MPFYRSDCYQHFLKCPFRNGLSLLWGEIYTYTHICPPPPFLKDINEHILYILFYILFFSLKKVNFGNCSILARMLLAHAHVPHTINLLVPFWTFRLEHILYRKCCFKVWYYMISYSSKEIFISFITKHYYVGSVEA